MRNRLYLGLPAWLHALDFHGGSLEITVAAWKTALVDGASLGGVPRLEARARKHTDAVLQMRCKRHVVHPDYVESSFELEAADLVRYSSFAETFDFWIAADGKSHRVRCPFWLERTVYSGRGYDLLPYATVDGNLSLSTVRRAPAAVIDATSRRPRGVIFVVQVNYSGGKTRAMLTLAEQLQELGFAMTVVALRLTPTPPAFNIPDGICFDYVDAVQFAHPNEAAPQFNWPEVLLSERTRDRLSEYFRRLDADFLYVPNYDSNLYEIITRELPPQVVSILGDHDPGRATSIFLHRKLPRGGRHEFFRGALKRFDAVHVLVPSVLAPVQEEATAQVFCVPNSIALTPRLDAERFFESRVIIAAGRLVPDKRFELLIRAAATLFVEHADWRLDIYGQGPEEEKLKQLILELKLNERVHLKGFSKDVRKQMKAAAFHATASRVESFGLTIAEAMNEGIPVLSSRHAGAEFLIGADARGLMAAESTVDAFGEAMGGLMTRIEQRDPTLVEMVQRAFDFSTGLGFTPVGGQWKEVLDSLLVSKNRRLAGKQA